MFLEKILYFFFKKNIVFSKTRTLCHTPHIRKTDTPRGAYPTAGYAAYPEAGYAARSISDSRIRRADHIWPPDTPRGAYPAPGYAARGISGRRIRHAEHIRRPDTPRGAYPEPGYAVSPAARYAALTISGIPYNVFLKTLIFSKKTDFA